MLLHHVWGFSFREVGAIQGVTGERRQAPLEPRNGGAAADPARPAGDLPMIDELAPPRLRGARSPRELAPVEPLGKPWLRAAAALPLGVLLLSAASAV